MDKPKRAESLTVEDLIAHPVWMFTGSDRKGETVVRPVGRLPVTSLSGKILGTTVTLANGSDVWALLGNIDQNNARLSEHYLTISIERAGRWFHLARYFDVDYARRGPEALATFLSLPPEQLFPITYDVRNYVSGGDPAALCGAIPRLPRKRLSIEELAALAVPPPVNT